MPDKEDFKLKPESPAVDKGEDIGLTEDIAGTAVPQGAAPEMGAYESAIVLIPDENYQTQDIASVVIIVHVPESEGPERFQLKPESPARDAGVDVGLTLDAEGKPVPAGAAPEMGAYELAAALAPDENAQTQGIDGPVIVQVHKLGGEGTDRFYLKPDSPLKDKGIGVGLTKDYEGRPVPMGTAPEIGAFEYQVATALENYQTQGIDEAVLTQHYAGITEPEYEPISDKDREKLIVAEINLAAEVESWAWGIPGIWTYVYPLSFIHGEIVSVVEDSKWTGNYLEVFSIAEVDATPRTFYYNPTTAILYVHTSDGDSPDTQVGGEYKYCIIVSFWKGFVNRKNEDYDTDFEREEQKLADPNLDRWSNLTAMEKWNISLSGTTTVERETATVYDENSYASVKISVDATGHAGAVWQYAEFGKRRKGRFQLKYTMTGAGDGAYAIIATTDYAFYLNSQGEWQAAYCTIPLTNALAWASFSINFVSHASYSGCYVWLGSNIANSIVYFDYTELYLLRAAQFYPPLLDDDSIPEAFHAIGDYYTGEDKIQSGTIKLIDNGSFAQVWSLFIWHNRTLVIKSGECGDAYSELTGMIYGLTRNPSLGEGFLQLDYADDRLSGLGNLTVKTFNLTDWPGMDPKFIGLPYPVLFGIADGIVPVRVDAKTYLISQTAFPIEGAEVIYPVHTSDSLGPMRVYKNGKQLIDGVGYTVDYNAGTITLTKKAKNAEIIVSGAAGVGKDFEDISISDDNFVATLYCFLKFCAGIDLDRVNLADLKRMKTSRNIGWGDWIGPQMTLIIDYLTKMRKSGLFQIYFDGNGRWRFPIYTSTVPATSQRFYNEDYTDFTFEEDTEGCFYGILFKSGYRANDGTWAEETLLTEDKVIYRYGTKEILTVESGLSLGDSIIEDGYKAITLRPVKRLTVILPDRANTIMPGDKAYFSYSLSTDKGVVTLLDAVVYRILELSKNLAKGTVKIMAVLDSESVTD